MDGSNVKHGKNAPSKAVFQAYLSLGILTFGLASLVFILQKPTSPAPSKRENGTSTNMIQIQRLAAMEQAQKEGKKEYSFTAQHLPFPLDQ